MGIEGGRRLFVCVWETEADPLSPQGYIITWIIRPGQPQKEESQTAIPVYSRRPLNNAGLRNVLCAQAHTQTK